LKYSDNAFAEELTTEVNVTSSGVELKYLDTSVGSPIDNYLEVNENGVTISSDGNSYTLPLTDGTAGQVLSTDGAGNLSWITP
jgi:hypothetical protein